MNPSKRPLFASSSRGVDDDVRGPVGRRARPPRRSRWRAGDERDPEPRLLGRASPAGHAGWVEDSRPARRLRGRAGRCDAPTGRLAAKSVDRARLGRKRATNRLRFRKGGRKRASVDRFCLADGRSGPGRLPLGPAPTHALAASNRRRTRGRAVLLLSSSARFSCCARSRPGTRCARASRADRQARAGYRVGANALVPGSRGAARACVFQVTRRHGARGRPRRLPPDERPRARAKRLFCTAFADRHARSRSCRTTSNRPIPPASLLPPELRRQTA